MRRQHSAARACYKTLFDHIKLADSLDDFMSGFRTVIRELAVQVLKEWKELRLVRFWCGYCLTLVCRIQPGNRAGTESRDDGQENQ
jgi:hypothetical protein